MFCEYFDARSYLSAFVKVGSVLARHHLIFPARHLVVGKKLGIAYVVFGDQTCYCLDIVLGVGNTGDKRYAHDEILAALRKCFAIFKYLFV